MRGPLEREANVAGKREARIAVKVARRWLPPDLPELTQGELDVLEIERVLKLILRRRAMTERGW